MSKKKKMSTREFNNNDNHDKMQPCDSEGWYGKENPDEPVK